MRKFFSMCLLAFAFCACQEKPFLSVSLQSLSFESQGGQQTIKVSSNNSWTASVSGSFVVSPQIGTGETTVIVTASANPFMEVQTGSISFTSEGLTASVSLTQSPKQKIGDITKDKTSLDFAGEGEVLSLSILPNVELDVQYLYSDNNGKWLAVDRTSDGSVLNIKADFNYYEERTASIILSDKLNRTDPVTINVKQSQSRFRQGLVKLYDALDGPNWTNADGWCTEASINKWEGIRVREVDGQNEGSITLQNLSLKGKLPDCFEDFAEILTSFKIQQQPYSETESRCLSGTLPPSFAKCTKLKSLMITNTWMSSLPDLFGDMPDLKDVNIQSNDKMTGPLPESLGNKEGMKQLFIGNNDFTGDVPLSWAVNATNMILERNCLSGVFPDFGKDNFLYFGRFNQKEGYSFDVTGRDFYGYWPEAGVSDAVTHKEIPFWDEVRSNKYTVMIHWGTWCPFSKELMPKLKAYYNKYHKDGLEVFAYTSDWSTDGGEDALTVIKREGYDKWYNFIVEDVRDDFFYGGAAFFYAAAVPVANVIDSEGKLIWSSLEAVDPVERRFSHIASSELIPFLETLFGPLSDADTEYSSTDYSMDGRVTTIQKASVGNGINIVFMGDGYTDRDISSNYYNYIMSLAADEFFAIEPYKSLRNRFNIYAVNVVSKNGMCGPGFETALGSGFGGGTYVEGDLDKCYEYAMKVPGINSRDNLVIPVIVNTPRSCGTTFMDEPTQSAVAFYSNGGINDPVLFGHTLRHEAGGHGFGFLSDEYITSSSTIPEAVIKQYKDQWEKYGWWANVDFTSDPSRIKWSKFLTDDRYKSEVGIYEGGATYRYGAWKPTANSMMNENLEYFNAPSREAIYKRIMELSGEGYSFEKFLEYDAINRTSAAKGTARPPLKAAARGEKQYGAPPVVIR